MERQLDPTDRSFIPRRHLPFLTNVTHRNWTAVGNPGSAWEAVVDPAGLVSTVPDGWSLDWWIGDGRGWVLSSCADGLRQWTDGAGCCVRTGVELPGGGQAVAAVYALQVHGGDYVAVEVTNRTDRAVTVAFAVRPYNPEGLAVVEDIAVTDEAVIVDGNRAVLPARPAGPGRRLDLPPRRQARPIDRRLAGCPSCDGPQPCARLRRDANTRSPDESVIDSVRRMPRPGPPTLDGFP